MYTHTYVYTHMYIISCHTLVYMEGVIILLFTC